MSRLFTARALTVRAFTVLALAALAFAPPAAADGAKPFADNKKIDLLQLLPPPPPNDSALTRRELGEVLSLQITRTPEQAKQAYDDSTEDIWRFSDAVNNPKFNAAALPKFSAFFERVFETEGAVVDPSKDVWKRPRPHQMSELVKPASKISNSGAWPSGHATAGTLAGIVLSNMLPEKRREIMTRAFEYGDNRLIGGIHFRSDVEMGRIAGTVIAQQISTQADYQSEFEAAKSEVRALLGM